MNPASASPWPPSRSSTEGNALSYSPDGRLLAATNTGGGLVIIDATSGQIVARLAGHVSDVGDLAWSPDGRYLVARSRGQVDVWRMPGERGEVVLGHGTVRSAHPHGRFVEIESYDDVPVLPDGTCTHLILDLERAAQVGPCLGLGSVTFAPGDEGVIENSVTGEVSVFPLTDGTTTLLGSVPPGYRPIDISADRRFVVARSNDDDGSIVVSKAAALPATSPVVVRREGMRTAEIVNGCGSAPCVLFIGEQVLELVALQSGEVSWTRDVDTSGAAVHVHGERILISRPARISVLDVWSGTDISVVEPVSEAWLPSPDGTLLAVEDNVATRVLDIDSGEVVAELAGRNVAGFTPDGEVLVSSDGPLAGFDVTVWSLRGRSPLQLQWTRTRAVYDSLFGPTSVYVDASTGVIVTWDNFSVLRLFDLGRDIRSVACAWAGGADR